MILETIAVIQTANAAIGAVKELVGNGKDLMDCGKELGEYFGAKSEIQKKADRNGSGNALEMFFELEKLKQQEEQLKEMMIYQGRPGMWTDWLNFQAQQKRAREDAEKEAKRKAMAKRKAIKNGLVVTGVLVLSFGLIGGAIAGLLWIISLKG